MNVLLARLRWPYLDFDRWSHAATERTLRERFYWRGWRWTPLVVCQLRYMEKGGQP